ncbi:hypothetical protein QYM36_010935 [Artemia franciscana]|uniref:FAM193 C-terminal domain-containing protein n=1 Tax=Artemia franciscana TaxID=6661 RepID=A0AA88L0N5_ARTSF|nr:hypothetical protein QYM36_010935 [Artemia franciscana]
MSNGAITSLIVDLKLGKIEIEEVSRFKYALDADSIFKPKENPSELDETERELEAFKRFCLDSRPTDPSTKLKVNLNVKDIFARFGISSEGGGREDYQVTSGDSKFCLLHLNYLENEDWKGIAVPEVDGSLMAEATKGDSGGDALRLMICT